MRAESNFLQLLFFTHFCISFLIPVVIGISRAFGWRYIDHGRSNLGWNGSYDASREEDVWAYC